MALNLELEALLEAQFCLVGEDVVRLSSGKVLEPIPSKRGYCYVSVANKTTAGLRVRFHRLKFFLAFGWMPNEVDHRDRDPRNNALANLRPSTHKQNMQNSSRRRHRDLPRGVFRSGKKFTTAVMHGGKVRNAGTYATVEEASSVVEAILREEHGDWYADAT